MSYYYNKVYIILILKLIMDINIEDVTAEEHIKLDRIFRIKRSLITFTGETADKNLRALEELASLKNKSFDAKLAYNLTREALDYLDELVNPIGFKSDLLDLPLGSNRSLTSVLGWSTYKVEGYPKMTRYHELPTEKGQIVHRDYCRILEIPQTGRTYPFARLLRKDEPKETIGGIIATAGG